MANRVVRAGIALAVLLAVAGCAGPSSSTAESAIAPTDAPTLVVPRVHHAAMRDRAEDYCARFGGEPALVDWCYRSTFGKRGEWLMQTLWACCEPAA